MEIESTVQYIHKLSRTLYRTEKLVLLAEPLPSDHLLKISKISGLPNHMQYFKNTIKTKQEQEQKLPLNLDLRMQKFVKIEPLLQRHRRRADQREAERRCCSCRNPSRREPEEGEV
ncbi:hypothetical protein M9H77_34270 [Catharanthus roseus]|uniref:Uncharacterized protein n=1 Tax=Catharanthus roseus TaxID=4058 RepID=A0ACB9ZPA9_CATRO|nr:hypothetical protein M9H77_34270 [Catharanthus roseus]